MRVKRENALVVFTLVVTFPLVFYGSLYYSFYPLVAYFAVFIVLIPIGVLQDLRLRKSLIGLWFDMELLNPFPMAAIGLLGGVLSIPLFYWLIPPTGLTAEASTEIEIGIILLLAMFPVVYIFHRLRKRRYGGMLVRFVHSGRDDVVTAIRSALDSAGEKYVWREARTMIVADAFPTVTFDYESKRIDVEAELPNEIRLLKKVSSGIARYLPSKADRAIDEALDSLEKTPSSVWRFRLPRRI